MESFGHVTSWTTCFFCFKINFNDLMIQGIFILIHLSWKWKTEDYYRKSGLILYRTNSIYLRTYWLLTTLDGVIMIQFRVLLRGDFLVCHVTRAQNQHVHTTWLWQHIQTFSFLYAFLSWQTNLKSTSSVLSVKQG